MASTEYIKKRLEGKEKELAKLEKKLERILKAEASGWGNNPYYYNQYDKKYTEKDIEAAKQAIEKYQADLKTAIEKDNSRNVTAIVRFLENWKDRVFKAYVNALPDFIEAEKEWYRVDGEYCDWWNNDRRKASPDERRRKEEERRTAKKSFEARWSWIMAYVDHHDVLDTEKLKKDLENEANRKYDFIIERTNAIVGTITDASNLTIGAKDDLNGYIIGEKGTAKVQTIGAGGYNIQCYHFRTLIREA